MRILLLSPPQKNVYGRFGPPYPPLGLLQIGACLKTKGHDVRFVDAALSPRRVGPVLRSFKPRLVCVTSVTPTFPAALEMAAYVKLESNASVVFGGPHPSMLPEESLRSGHVDFVVVGEGEVTVPELAEALDSADPSKVPGLSMKEDGEIVFTGKRAPFESLDSLAFPDWDLVERPAAYVPPEARGRKVFTCMTSRGCPFDCSFCVSSKLFGRKTRRRSVGNVIAEIEQLVEKHVAKEIHFADDCFTSDREWTLDFCDAFSRLKSRLTLSFMNGLRADQVDEELLLALKRAGVRTVGFGVETGDKGLMDESGKSLSLDAVENAFRISKKIGLNAWGFFIIGFPGETRQQALRTFDLALNLEPDFAKFFPLVPYPGSEIFVQMKEAGILDNPDWADFGLYSDAVPTLSKMSPEEIAELLSMFYRRFYLRPGKMFSRLSKLRSVPELLLNLRSLLFLSERFTPRLLGRAGNRLPLEGGGARWG